MTGLLRTCLVAALLLLWGCGEASSESETSADTEARRMKDAACTDVAADLGGSLQDQLDYLATLASQEAVGPPPPGTDVEYLLAGYRERLEELDCGEARAAMDLRRELDSLQVDGPVVSALAVSLRARLLGGEPDSVYETTVAVGDDLGQAILAAPSGATLLLDPGDHVVDEPLVVSRPLQIVGAGAASTRIVSRAEEVALMANTVGQVTIEDLTLAYEGDAGASVLVLRTSSYVVRGVRVTGGTVGSKARFGAGIVVGAMPSGPPAPVGSTARAPRLIENTEVEGNEAGGIFVIESAGPELVELVIYGNGGCGVCFSGSGDGALENSRLRGNGEGVAVAGAAAPRIVDNEILDSRLVGVLALDQAAPVLESNLVVDSGEAALVFRNEATGSVATTTCGGSPFGLALLEAADPVLGDNDCELHDERD